MSIKMMVTVFAAIIVSANSFAYTVDDKSKATPGIGTAENNLSEMSLSSVLETQLTKAISEAKARYNYDAKNFIITKTSQCNASKFALQVENYLVGRGTKVQAYGTKSIQLKGYTIIKNETCFEIIIGIM